MGLSCSICRKNKRSEIVLLLVGLDNAGKTVAGRGLAGESVNTVVPTMGFSIIHLRYGDFSIKIFDLGGGVSIRGIWQKYFADVHGVIFVIDASDVTRLDEAKLVFESLISDGKISGKPVLLFANKQDNESALDEIEIIEKLQLESLVNIRKCPTLVECCSAKDVDSKSKIDPAIKRGYDWLVNYIIMNYEELNARVEKDTQEQKITEERLLKQKTERFKHLQENTSHSNGINGISKYSIEYELNRIDRLDSLPGAVINESYSTSKHSTPVESRPNSAVHVVHQHLVLNGDRKSSNKSKNKTYPLQLYNMRYHSAGAQRKVYKQEQRNLKSAGDVKPCW